MDEGSYEPMCNPIGQAKLLNAAGTDLNVIVCLCVGHDTLFIKYSEAPVCLPRDVKKIRGSRPPFL
ncbi:Protein of unknown function DUF1847 [Moorella glycerini]|uniref:DUF1847 domain-containing protein n=1 Tax=Neomoorella stamsii TaxID=1266720 RepID=A0A9X7J0T5_9FIRM|nr:hypothetical protein MOST_27480 [Moorella stamsii]CEP66361.1 Protein of unknown function DUF1847 [Moorella glycerini]